MQAAQQCFVRRTTLGEDEYRKNFRQIDCDAIKLLKSSEARKVTRLMATLYLTLIDAPTEYWEREGVLRFAGDAGEKESHTAWQQLVAFLDCGNTTAKKALDWMHEQGIIGYYAGKNGAGIRIFINRASSSIGRREKQKNLRLVRTPVSISHTPTMGTPFKDSFAVLEVSDTDINPHAPKNGAEQIKVVKTAPDIAQAASSRTQQATNPGEIIPHGVPLQVEVPIDEIVTRLSRQIEPALQSASREASAQEHERMREWLENRGLPKVARVAQREAYNVLRQNGFIQGTTQSLRTGLNCNEPTLEPQLLSESEIEELAQVCVAMFQAQAQSIELTLSEMSVEAGGLLLPGDALRVFDRANALLSTNSE